MGVDCGILVMTIEGTWVLSHAEIGWYVWLYGT